MSGSAPTMGQDGANSGGFMARMQSGQQTQGSMNPMRMSQAYGSSKPFNQSGMNMPTQPGGFSNQMAQAGPNDYYPGAGASSPGGAMNMGGMVPQAQSAGNSMNPMAMLQSYRQGQSMQQVNAMNQPTPRPAQYLPPAMAPYTPPPAAAPTQQGGGLMGGGNPNGNYLSPDEQWMRNYDAGGGGG